MCPICKGTGYVVETHTAIHDGAYLPEYITVNCACNPEPTDEDVPEWEPDGTAFEDFHRFNDRQYSGI